MSSFNVCIKINIDHARFQKKWQDTLIIFRESDYLSSFSICSLLALQNFCADGFPLWTWNMLSIYRRYLLNSQGISVRGEESALNSGATPDLILFPNIPQITPCHPHILCCLVISGCLKFLLLWKVHMSVLQVLPPLALWLDWSLMQRGQEWQDMYTIAHPFSVSFKKIS